MVESANVKIDDLKLRQVIPYNISTYDNNDGEYQNEENEPHTDDEDDEETPLAKAP
jgi:hypothetical protein